PRMLLSRLTVIHTVNGPTMISSENGLLRGLVTMDVRGRDVGGFVDEAKRVLTERIQLPAGYYFEWSGEYENQRRAKSRLELVLPIVLLVIFIMLYLTYHSVIEAAHVLLAVPLSLAGGVPLLFALCSNLSVAVSGGCTSVFRT